MIKKYQGLKSLDAHIYNYKIAKKNILKTFSGWLPLAWVWESSSSSEKLGCKDICGTKMDVITRKEIAIKYLIGAFKIGVLWE